MKQKKQDPGDDENNGEEPSSTRGRGRGPGGRGGKGKGRGRGRGRGKKNEEGDAGKDEKAKASSSKANTHVDEPQDTVDKKPKTRNGKAKESEDDGWAAWGTDDAWTQGWGDDGWNYSAWAWDSAAYWDAQASKHGLEDASAPHKSKESKASKLPKSHPNQNKEEDAPKEPKVEEKSSSKKRATKEVEAKTEFQSHGRRKQARTSKSNGDDAADDTKFSKKKRSREATPAEDGSPAHETRKGKARAAAAAPPEPEGEASTKAVKSDVLPRSKKGRLEEIIAFMDGFKGMKEDHAYMLMRGRLQGTHTCRLNVYGKRATPSCGVHCRPENKDFGHISLSNSACPRHMRLAAASKAAEMLVTCMCTVVVLWCWHLLINL